MNGFCKSCCIEECNYGKKYSGNIKSAMPSIDMGLRCYTSMH